MATTDLRLVAGSLLTASTATYYTAGTGVTATIDAALLVNNDTAARTVTLYLVPNNGTADTSNIILPTVSLAAGARYLVREAINQRIEAGGTIQAKASVASVVTLMVSGREKNSA